MISPSLSSFREARGRGGRARRWPPPLLPSPPSVHVSLCRRRARERAKACTWIFLQRRGLPPFDLFLAVECNRGPRPSWLQAPPDPREGNAGVEQRGEGGGGVRVLHVFRLINIRENPLNWVIKRLRRHSNRERVTLGQPHLLSLFLSQRNNLAS